MMPVTKNASRRGLAALCEATRAVLASSPGAAVPASDSSSSVAVSRRAYSGLLSSSGSFRPMQMHNGALSNQRYPNVTQKRSVFIQTETTPNPESIKFVPTGVAVLPMNEDGDGSLNGFFVSKKDPGEDIRRSPLAKELFRVDGVKAVYLGTDFVTITKYAEHKWKIMRPELFSVLMDFFDSGKAALLDAPEITDTTILDDDDEVVAMIKELIEARIRPAVQEDGGDIRYVAFAEDTGIVTVQLAGSCVGCPSSSVTLKNGVENMLMHYIPEVTAVEALEEEADDGDGEDTVVEVTKSSSEDVKKQKSYEDRLAAAGIPFSE